MAERKRAFFLDRDGVINRGPAEGDYVKSWENFELLPTVASAMIAIRQKGYEIVVVTNQKGIAKGLLTQSELEDIHQKMRRELLREGVEITQVYYCHHWGHEPECDCRKPKPGMIFKAATEHGIDLSVSWMIGDADTDEAAARAAGVPFRMLERDGDLLKLVGEILTNG